VVQVLVCEEEFDAIFDRMKQRGIPFWADPMRQRQNEINTSDSGRGAATVDVYVGALDDPNAFPISATPACMVRKRGILVCDRRPTPALRAGRARD
jgi:hypothetical protein